ncbi:nucleolar protein 16 isoform X1 [Indicator indicator]|uniref:nucleolar protein 16 isoform X1 n=1 Tax=Indicator indicator TaxID=1002788 RepID=UPI0023DF8D89|nr:nucleolar protein 16 isoform X1 [Indicator indicator]
MPKAKGKGRRQKYSYNLNRKRLYRSARRRAAPRIACSHIRHAWDPTKSVAQNLADMGLAEDPNKAVPIPKKQLLGMEVESDGLEQGKKIVRKPYVVNEMEYEASLPEKKSNTLSRDLIDYVRYMIQNHGENYKEMARDEKNYYQDTPKQIKRKINVYKNFYPEEYKDFIASLKPEKMDVQ